MHFQTYWLEIKYGLDSSFLLIDWMTIVCNQGPLLRVDILAKKYYITHFQLTFCHVPYFFPKPF